MTKLYAFAGIALLLALPVLADGHEKKADAPHDDAMAAMYEAWTKAMTPGPQHAMLEEMTGKYAMTIKYWTAPGGEPTVNEGHCNRTMALGGRVLVEEVEATMMDQPFHGHGMTGYDNVSGKWWSTWNDNMSTGVFVSHGKYDEEAGTMTFVGESSDPTKPDGKSLMTIVIERHEDGSEVATFYEGEGDAKHQTMLITYKPM